MSFFPSFRLHPKRTAVLAATLALTSSVWAQSAATTESPAAAANGAANAAPAKKLSTRVVLLGTAAGPIPRKDRSQPANLLIVGGRPYLIDAGNGVSRQLAHVGLAPSDVRTVFITHHHTDHNADMVALMSFAWIEDAKRNDKTAGPIRFYGPPATADMVKAGYNYMSVAERIFRAGVPMPPATGRFEGHDIQGEGEVFRDDRIVVSAIENSHYHGSAPGPDKSYSYRFDAPDRSVVFCGDSGPSEALTRLAHKADVLVCEVNDLDASMQALTATTRMPPQVLAGVRAHMAKKHMTAEELGRLAQKAGVKSVVLTHISPGLDGETDASRYTDGVRQHYQGPVIAGRDLMEF